MGMCGNFFFENLGSQILVFQCDSVSLTPMYAMINPYIVFLTCFVCVDDGAKCGWGLGEGPNFQLVRWPQN